jgi:hypothetical protein
VLAAQLLLDAALGLRLLLAERPQARLGARSSGRLVTWRFGEL